ncbi:MAG: hypothetical protein WBO12_23740, partial [Xanthobacteraceae bacterium]
SLIAAISLAACQSAAAAAGTSNDWPKCNAAQGDEVKSVVPELRSKLARVPQPTHRIQRPKS